MLDDESGKSEGYLYLHDVYGIVNGRLGLDSALWGFFVEFLI